MGRLGAKLAILAAAAIVIGAVLLVLTARARREGRQTWCRNNLRQIGVVSYSHFREGWDLLPPERGRPFLNLLRRTHFYDETREKWTRITKLNFFCCPVRGTGPTDLSTLVEDAAYAKFMADPATIDYRGPGEFPEERGPVVLAADLEGNHAGGGYVLLTDFSVRKVADATTVSTEWSRAGKTKD